MKKVVVIIILAVAAVITAVYVRARTKPVLDDKARSNAPGSFVETPNGLVHYELAGNEDGHTVVFIHGASVPYAIWDSAFGFLANAGFRVLRYDLLGRGYSDRPRIEYTWELYLNQFENLIKKLGVKPPVAVIGLSMGGGLTGFFAGTRPDLVDAIVLINPAGPYLHQTTREERFGLAGKRISRLWNKPPPHVKEREEKLKPLLEKARRQLMFRNTEWATFSFLRNRDPDIQEHAFENVGKSGIPCLLIWGEEDPLLPVKYSAEIKKYIPQSELHIIERAGHTPHYDQPGTVNPIILNFLEKHLIHGKNM